MTTGENDGGGWMLPCQRLQGQAQRPAGMTEGRRVSMCGVGLGSDPSPALVLSEVEWIRMTMGVAEDLP